MAKSYDATLKELLEGSPDDWPVLLGLPRARADVIDADVSTFTGAADKVLRVRGQPDWILHLEFQSGPDESLPRRLHTANVLLDGRHGLLVRSVAVLLRPRAFRSNLTGLYERGFEGRDAHLVFRYQILRVWQTPVETFLTGGLGLLPLAPISAVRKSELPSVVKRIQERLSKLELRADAARLWTATLVLMGLRYPKSLAERLLQEVIGMEESVTYQAIVQKGRELGRLEELRRTLLLQGAEKFGSPDASTAATVEAVEDIQRLERLAVHLLHASNWEELLALPKAVPGRRRRKPKA